jgi:membrane-associated protease RseP (regulator of RpoE activity)
MAFYLGRLKLFGTGLKLESTGWLNPPVSWKNMFTVENYATFALFFLAIGMLGWGYYRNRSYGKLGTLAWLQSAALMLPWLVFFGSFALGIYINLAVVLVLLIGSTALYIWLGNRLRRVVQDPNFEGEMAKRMNRYQSDPGNAEAVKDIPEMPHLAGEDLEKIRGIFGIDTFFATETIPYQQGAIFKGNLRGEPAAAHDRLQANLKNILGDKYRLYLIEGPEERPVVLVMPTAGDMLAMTVAQKVLAVILLLATIASTLETAGVFLGFDFYNNLQKWPQVAPLALGLWTVLLAHEAGHWFVAQAKQVKLSWPSFLPTAQVGAFGAITRFADVLPDRTTLFDISIAGPAAGGITSLGMLLTGLLLSKPEGGLEIPSQFFQGSILVGSLAKVILGAQIHKDLVNIHPLVVIGWLGLVITALNLMPAGQLDGGRIVQAIYGRKIAQRTTVATLILLAIVSFTNPNNSVILYWALLVGFLQRGLEKPSLNELSEPDDTRAAITLLALFLMIATILPFSPELAGRFGIGD